LARGGARRRGVCGGPSVAAAGIFLGLGCRLAPAGVAAAAPACERDAAGCHALRQRRAGLRGRALSRCGALGSRRLLGGGAFRRGALGRLRALLCHQPIGERLRRR